jgi:HEPN domain-containing protein
MKRITEDWLESARLDLDSIEMVITKEHLTPIASFHAQQVVEKSFKAYLEEKEVPFRKIHDVVTLYGMLSEELPKLDIAILERLDDLYIDARYPGELGLLPNGKPSVDDAWKFYEFAKYVFEEVKSIIEKD